MPQNLIDQVQVFGDQGKYIFPTPTQKQGEFTQIFTESNKTSGRLTGIHKHLPIHTEKLTITSAIEKDKITSCHEC